MTVEPAPVAPDLDNVAVRDEGVRPCLKHKSNITSWGYEGVAERTFNSICLILYIKDKNILK